MTFYKTRQEAQTVADALDDTRIAHTKVELEPGNGWCVVIFPKFYDLTEYGDRFEVRDPVTGRRLTPRLAPTKAPVRAPVRAPAPAKAPVKTVLVAGDSVIKPPWET